MSCIFLVCSGDGKHFISTVTILKITECYVLLTLVAGLSVYSERGRRGVISIDVITTIMPV